MNIETKVSGGADLPGRRGCGGLSPASTSLIILLVTLAAIAAVLGPAAFFYVRAGL